jgi:hypothetical protein
MNEHKTYLDPDPCINAVTGAAMVLSAALATRRGVQITPKIQSAAARAATDIAMSVMGNRSMDSEMLPADLLLYMAGCAREVIEVSEQKGIIEWAD